MPENESDAGGRRQDPRVERLRPDPSQPPARGRSLAGLWGNSDREGLRRLYLTRDLGIYAEFRLDDVLGTDEIPPERSPFLGEQATSVELRHGADVEITHVRRVGEVDEFDLDVRFSTGARRAFGTMYASSEGNACVEPGEVISPEPCNYSCGWICDTYEGPVGRGCPGGGVRQSAECGTGTCVPCHTDLGYTQCGTCDTDVGATRCGTCYTDWYQTNCGGCDRVPARGR